MAFTQTDAAPAGADGHAFDKTAKIACKQVWKLFGSQPGDFLAQHDYKPSDEQLRRGRG